VRASNNDITITDIDIRSVMDLGCFWVFDALDKARGIHNKKNVVLWCCASITWTQKCAVVMGLFSG